MPGSAPPLAAGATWRFLGTVVRIAVSFLSVPILTRLLGMSQWGVLALCQAAVAPLALLDAGFGAASVRYVAQSVGAGERRGAVQVVHTTLMVNLAMGLAGAAALAGLAGWLASSVFAIPAERAAAAATAFRLIGLAWLVGMTQGAWVSTVAAHQRYDVLLRIGTISTALTAAAQVIAAVVTRDLRWVVAGQVVVATAVALIYRRVADRLLPGAGGPPRFDRAAFGRSARFGGWQVTATVGGMLAGWADRYVLGILSSPAVVGAYAVAHAVYIQLYGTFGELGEVLFPAVSHREGQADLVSARRLTLLAGWTLTSVFGACAAVVAAVGGDFLHLWISPDVARAATGTLRVLCAAGVVGIAAVAPFQYVLGVGEPRWNAVCAPLLGLTVLTMSLVLVPRLGLPGVGYGLLAGMILRWGFVALIWRAHFSAEASLPKFAVQVWAPAAAALLVMSGLVLGHDAIGRDPTWPWLVAEGAGATVVAAAAQLAMGELLPGGPARRRDVIASFRPVLLAALRRRGHA
ncbi:lipopolysaccharide biosynthesis protein [Anaeromyxobacter dehalogenans]|uniref:lipopolysaccharide biosynthesis protein n=1 Tax=Anaeromyxobacter dehalogenans TaxID=161493 RepID=UPI00059E2073|nr:oligosaccharide flippase family protein [Anaeromyxobacter dehalogenans]